MKSSSNEVYSYLNEKGLEHEQAIKFIENNPKLFEYSIEQIMNKMSFIYNGNELYAIIFCDDNNLYWSTRTQGDFSNLFIDNPKIDYIVQMIIGNLNRDKINNYSNHTVKTLEQKMIIYRDMSKDAPGYNIK